jgi:nicotinamidase/pyrazinamidase
MDGRTALLVVDMQRDFFEGGSLPVEGAEEIVPVVNKLLEVASVIVTTQDWHPENSEHFDRFPVHCVRNTDGARLHPDLVLNNRCIRYIKGMYADEDALSAFDGKSVNHDIGLTEMLEELHVTNLVVCGLATDYCVYATAKGARARGFEVCIVTDAVRAVGDNEEALKVLSDLDGLIFKTSEEVLAEGLL